MAKWPVKQIAETQHFEIDQITATTMNYTGDLVAFAKRLEDAYAVLDAIDPDPNNSIRDQNKIAVVFIDLKGIASLSFQSHVEFSGYFDPELVRETGRDLILLNPEGSLDESLIHRAVHEIQHLFLSTRCPNAPLWLNEGLSELLAWRVTPTLEPLVATAAFLSGSTPRPLEQVSRADLSMADYGQSYLFVRYLWEQRKEHLGTQSEEQAGVQLFQEMSSKNGCLPSELSPGKSAESERDFIYSLLLPGNKENPRTDWIRWRFFFEGFEFTRARSSLSGITFALVDATQAIQSGKSLGISAAAPLEADLVTVTQSDQMSIQPLSASLNVPEQNLKSAEVLILNLSGIPADYSISFQ